MQKEMFWLPQNNFVYSRIIKTKTIKVMKKEKTEQQWLKAYRILSNAGFRINIEDGGMGVWHREYSMQIDIENMGMALVPHDELEAWEASQDLVA
jgi:hypothetical protein